MFKEEELTRKIIGVAMSVHRELGPGFKENVYHKALYLKLLEELGMVEREKQFIVRIDGEEVGKFRIDLLVGGRVIVEIKVIDTIMPRIFRTQMVSYLKASGLEIGLLINFGKPSLEFKRIPHYHNYVRSQSVWILLS